MITILVVTGLFPETTKTAMSKVKNIGNKVYVLVSDAGQKVVKK